MMWHFHNEYSQGELHSCFEFLWFFESITVLSVDLATISKYCFVAKEYAILELCICHISFIHATLEIQSNMVVLLEQQFMYFHVGRFQMQLLSYLKICSLDWFPRKVHNIICQGLRTNSLSDHYCHKRNLFFEIRWYRPIWNLTLLHNDNGIQDVQC